MVSFETIAQTIEARKIVGYITDKDFASYVNSIYDNKHFFGSDNATDGKINEKFFARGYETECAFSDDRYDDDINRYFDMCLTAADEQGTALLTARIYRRYDGLVKPETVTVYRNGCTEELAHSLEHFFG